MEKFIRENEHLTAAFIGTVLGVVLAYLSVPFTNFYRHFWFQEENLMSASVYYNEHKYEDWFIKYKVESSVGRKYSYYPGSNEVIIHEAEFGKITFWTHYSKE